MKHWISRLRAQRLRERLRASGGLAGNGADGHPNDPLIRLALGIAIWMLVCTLFRTKAGEAVDKLDWSLELARGEFLLLVGTLIAAGLCKVLTPNVFRNNGKLVLLALCGLASVLPAHFLLHSNHAELKWLANSTADFLIPFALAPLLAGVLLGAAAATIAGLWASYVCTVLFDNSLAVLVTGLIATATVASWVTHVRRRTRIIRLGLFVGLAETAGVVALLDSSRLSSIINQVLACLMDGIGSSLMVVLVLPLFERLFGITTNITLLELSDLGHPLLQRLAFEAPGTYHHSLMVANLAHSGADAIGANPILARVGAYFHDIGKLTKPGLFAENIRGTENPHDGLAPSMSALLVMAHVKEGLSLALLHKLPKAVLDIIQQHHGTGLVAFFHHKAGRQAEAAGQEQPGRAGAVAVDQSPYRYTGPRPVSREAAIIMLADAVEAASRSLEKPTPTHISELVDRLVDSRFEDSQLDESEMTLAELARVKQAFVFCLSSMLHSRMAYPK